MWVQVLVKEDTPTLKTNRVEENTTTLKANNPHGQRACKKDEGTKILVERNIPFSSAPDAPPVTAASSVTLE